MRIHQFQTFGQTELPLQHGLRTLKHTLEYTASIFACYRISRIESRRYGICVIVRRMLRAHILKKNYSWEFDGIHAPESEEPDFN